MKTGTKTAAILTALLAGAMIAEAQPYPKNQGQRQRQGRQGKRQVQARRQGCPLCGNLQFRPQGQRQRQQQSRQGTHQLQSRRGQRQQPGRQGGPQQFKRRQGPQQFRQQNQGQRQQCRGSRGQSGPDSRQLQQRNQKKLQAMLKKFDTDRDGQLSKEERKAVREAMEKRQRGKPGHASKRPGPTPGEE